MKVELWICLKAPAISDGNNFGADVQNCVLAEIKTMRHGIEGFLGGADAYHWARGIGVEKLVRDASTETSTSSNTTDETEGDKKTSKASTSTSKKENSKASPPIADFVSYAVAIDVKQYQSTKSQLTSLRNCYLKAHALVTKNMKKLADPRGDGGGTERGVMSMF
jgi:hypothetical protein